MSVLSDYFELVRGTTYKSALLDQPGPILLGLASIQRNGGFRRDSLRTYGGDSPEKLLVRPGDLYVSLKDVTQSADLLGSIARLPDDIALGRLTQDTVRLVPKDDTVPSTYMHWLLRTPQYREYCRSHATGTTNLGLSRDDFLAYPVPALNDARQALVGQLDLIEAKIGLNQRMNATLDEMARALFKSWFVDFDPVRAKAEGRQPSHMDAANAALFPDSFEDSKLGAIPAGWRTGRLSDAIEINPPRTLKKGTKATYVDMAALPTAGPELSDSRLRDFTSGSRFTRGDTLLARITPCLENGKTALVDFLTPDEVGWGSTEFIVLCPRSPLPDEFAYALARDSAFREHAVVNMTGTSGRQRVPPDAIAAYQLAIPSDDVARRFGQVVHPWFDLIHTNSIESRTLAELRDTLLPKLISGELRVGSAAPETVAAV